MSKSSTSSLTKYVTKHEGDTPSWTRRLCSYIAIALDKMLNYNAIQVRWHAIGKLSQASLIGMTTLQVELRGDGSHRHGVGFDWASSRLASHLMSSSPWP